MRAILQPYEVVATDRTVGPDAYPSAKARANSKANVAKRAAIARFLFGTLAMSMLFGVASGFGGQLLVEETRRASIKLDQRAVQAEADNSLLREQLGEMQSVEKVDAWASLNGFVSSYLVSK
jgi:hypothetical protein